MTAENVTLLEPVLGKDEIGWMFVQEYYTYLNKEPNRLHCFYTKKSTLIHGDEGESISLCHGQQEIHNKILDLDFQNCKVLISNVDSLASSNGGIVIQVLGEMSNKGKLSRKFAQTFFLAEQPNGYFVLNDIFRFLREDVEEEEESPDAVEKEKKDVASEPYVNGVQSQEHLPSAKEEGHYQDPAATENNFAAAALISNETDSLNQASLAVPEEPVIQVTEASVPSFVSQQENQLQDEALTSNSKNADAIGASDANVATAPKSWADLIARNHPDVKSQASVSSTASTTGQTVKSVNADQTQQPTAPYTQSNELLETSVFVKNIPPETSDVSLKSAMSIFGPVKAIEFARRKGTAYVDFVNHECVQLALNKKTLQINNATLNIEERRRLFSGKFNKSGDKKSNDNYNGMKRNFRKGNRGAFDGRSKEVTTSKKQNN